MQTGGPAFTNQIPSEIGGIIGILAALLVLLVFRSVWAAALPVITGVAGVGLSTVTVMLLSHLLDMSDIVISMSALTGLGVGIDYALFIVNRQPKALRAGADVRTATGPPAGGGHGFDDVAGALRDRVPRVPCFSDARLGTDDSVSDGCGDRRRFCRGCRLRW